MKKIILFSSVFAIIVNCSGPTKAGIEARANANSRMNAVNADLAAQQAKQQFEVGQLDSATATIESAINRYNEKGEYHLLHGRILLERHQLDQAYAALKNAVECNSQLAEPHYFLGILHQRWGEDAQAIKEYKKAMSLDTSHPQYLLAAAESHVALGEHEEAIALLNEASQEFQHHPTVSSLLGHIYLSKGKPNEAIAWLEDSRLLGNDNHENTTAIATAQFQAAKYADCLVTLARLEDQQKSLAPAFKRLRGKCLASTGRLVEGRDICLIVTRETPDEKGAWEDLGFIAWEMGDYERLAVCGEKITSLDSKASEGPLFSGIAAMHLGDLQGVEDAIISIESDNDVHNAHLVLTGYVKKSKNIAQKANTPNMDANSAEGANEPRAQELIKGSQPIASVDSNSPEVP